LPKNHRTLPTEQELLNCTPIRKEYPWEKQDDGLITLEVPKFTSSLGKSLCRLLRKQQTFTSHLDAFGSIVWEHCDGHTSVKAILDKLKKTFPDEENLDQRLFLFLQQMDSLNYIELYRYS